MAARHRALLSALLYIGRTGNGRVDWHARREVKDWILRLMQIDTLSAQIKSKSAQETLTAFAAVARKAEADKKAAMASLAAELDSDAEKAAGKESAEAVAALKDFGVNTLGARMKKFWRLPPNIPENLSVKIFVRLDRSGNVVQASTKQSSGYKLFDDAALRAVHDASPLPMPKHPGAVDALVSDGIITKFDP